MHEYAKWLNPLQSRRQNILEESYLHVFTQLDDYHILKAVVERGLTCIILSCIYNGNFAAQIGIKYAKAVSDNLSVCCRAKSVFHFPGVETFFSAFLCAQLLQAMQM